MYFTKYICALVIWFCAFTAAAEQGNLPAKNSTQRIVALAPHIVEMLFEIGAGDKIIGTVDYADYPKAALDIERVGGYYGLQIERVLALKPDLVLAWKSGNKMADLEQLERLGLNVAYSEPGKIEDVARELKKFGVLVGEQENAELSASRYQKRLASLKSRYQGQKKLKVFYQLWPEPMMTINKNTWIHQVIETCAGDNVFANNSTDYPQIGVENVLVTMPEIIILPDERSDKEVPVIDWKKWQQIPAVKHDRFISVNADLLHRFSPRMLNGVENLCSDIDNFRQKN